jgi:bifunctional enzyme CysN/CysC
MPVQMVERDAQSRRFLLGTVEVGQSAVGDEVISAVSGVRASVQAISMSRPGGAPARTGDAINIELNTDVDIGRGDLLAGSKIRPQVADQFAARILWVGDEPMLPGRSWLLQIGTRTVPAMITTLKHEIDIETGTPRAAATLGTYAIGAVNVVTTGAVAFDSYKDLPSTGGFVLIDRANSATVAVGFIDHPLRRLDNIHPQALTMSRLECEQLKG